MCAPGEVGGLEVRLPLHLGSYLLVSKKPHRARIRMRISFIQETTSSQDQDENLFHLRVNVKTLEKAKSNQVKNRSRVLMWFRNQMIESKGSG